MIPAQFEYERPSSLQAVLTLLGDDTGDSVLLGGGHSLVPLLKLRMATPDRVIDLGGLAGLDGISEDVDGLRIGALATHATIGRHDVVRSRYQLLAEAASGIGDAQVRDWGTIGGACAHAHPAADWPAALIAARADLVCQSLDGERVIPAREFFLGVFTTALEPTEMLTEIRVPRPAARNGSAYLKLVRPAGDFAVVGVAATAELGPDGSVARVGIGLTGVAEVAFAATAAEEMLVGEPPSAALFERAAEAAANASDPTEDANGSEAYKRGMAREMTRRALASAFDRAALAASDSSEPTP